MSADTLIEWADHTFNPWVGCTKVSPGCDHCYAEAWSNRFRFTDWGPHGKRRLKPQWRDPIKRDREAREVGRVRRVFCASLADWLDNKAPQEWRERLADLIGRTPNLIWMLLTKRPENLTRLSPWPADRIPGNVWLGATCEDQEHYDKRWPLLASFGEPSVRFVSYEPALGPIDLHTHDPLPDWIICGGESGPNCRHMDPEWAMSVMRQTDRSPVKFFMKQMTGKRPIPPELMRREWPEAAQTRPQ